MPNKYAIVYSSLEDGEFIPTALYSSPMSLEQASEWLREFLDKKAPGEMYYIVEVKNAQP